MCTKNRNVDLNWFGSGPICVGPERISVDSRAGLDPNEDQIRIWQPNGSQSKQVTPERKSVDPHLGKPKHGSDPPKWIAVEAGWTERGSSMVDSCFNFEPNFEGLSLELGDKLYMKVVKN